MRVLAFVEDPGAANWMAPLVGALADDMVVLTAAGSALSYLADRGLTAIPLESDVDAETLLARHRPDLLVTGTSENLESPGLALVDAARRAGVPSAALVDQAANAEHRFRGTGNDPLGHAPDLVLVPDDRAAQAFVGLGLARDAIAVTGNPHHDRVLARAAELEAEGRAAVRARVAPDAAGLPLVVFLAEVGYVVNPEAERWSSEFNFEGRDGQSPRCARMLEELLDALAGLPQRSYVVLRLHPKNTRDEFETYGDAIDLVSQGGDPLSLVWAADLVVGLSGSLLEEAYLMGRPCLSILPHRAERAWLPGLQSGAIPMVEDRVALRRHLAQPWLAEPARRRSAGTAAAAMAAALHRLAASGSTTPARQSA